MAAVIAAAAAADTTAPKTLYETRWAWKKLDFRSGICEKHAAA